MATLKQRVHRFNGTDYDTIHYETSADIVLYTNNSQSTVSGALDDLYTNKAASSHNHAASNITSGTLGVSRGGTGASTLTSGSYILGNGTSAVQFKTAAEVLSHIGAAASSHTHTASQISGLPSGVTTYSGNSFTIPGNGIYFAYVSGSSNFQISGSSDNTVLTYTIKAGSSSSEVVYSSKTAASITIVSTGSTGRMSYDSAIILFVFNNNGFGYSPHGGSGSSNEDRYNMSFKVSNPTTIKNTKYNSSYADMKVAYILF